MNESLIPAAQVILALVPIIGVSLAAILIFFVLLWRHHENKLRIIKGVGEQGNFNFKAFSLLTGMCLLAVGAVLTAMLIIMAKLSWALLAGLIPLAIGIVFLVFYKINPDFRQNSPGK